MESGSIMGKSVPYDGEDGKMIRHRPDGFTSVDYGSAPAAGIAGQEPQEKPPGEFEILIMRVNALGNRLSLSLVRLDDLSARLLGVHPSPEGEAGNELRDYDPCSITSLHDAVDRVDRIEKRLAAAVERLERL